MVVGVLFILDPMGYFCLSLGNPFWVARLFYGKKAQEGLESDPFIYILNYLEGKKSQSVWKWEDVRSKF